MAKTIRVTTRMGGQFDITGLTPDYNFLASMKAAKADGAIITDTFVIPWEAIDSVMLMDADMLGLPPTKSKQN